MKAARSLTFKCVKCQKAVQVYLQKDTVDEYRVAAVHQVPSMTLLHLQTL